MGLGPALTSDEPSPPRLRDTASRLTQSHPYLSAQMLLTEKTRDSRLSEYAGSSRLSGYEQLQNHLQAVDRDYQSNKVLKDLAFLVTRTQGDFQTCLEAILSGFPAVAQDAMRDVMEIEFLLREFFFEPTHIREWLTCSDRERHNRFRPAVLRQRYAARLGKRPDELGEAKDYKGHSMFLHVSPYLNPFGGPGLVASDVWADSGFWELFSHARSVVHSFHFLRRKIAPKLKASARAPRFLKDLRIAWQETQVSQTVWLAAMRVMGERRGTNPSGDSGAGAGAANT
jgi:hypothetical protein